MRIERTYRYDGQLAAVMGVILDPDVYHDAAVRSGAVEHDVTVTDADGARTIVLRRMLPTDQVPSFAQGLVGPQLTVVETTRWQSFDADAVQVDGSFDVQIERAPVTFRGTMTVATPGLIAGMPGAEHAIAGELKAAVPLLGKRIETAIEPLVRHQLDVLAEIVGTRLAQ